jgi:hypothetical protein
MPSSTPSWPPLGRCPFTPATGSYKRSPFALQGCGELGPGSVHRAIVATQRIYFDAPDFRSGPAGKYARG